MKIEVKALGVHTEDLGLAELMQRIAHLIDCSSELKRAVEERQTNEVATRSDELDVGRPCEERKRGQSCMMISTIVGS
jgi:hypothetical protein